MAQLPLTDTPPAMAALVPVIAADKGRHRARTLLNLVGADLDYVDRRLPLLDRALGTDSPGLPALSALVQAARRATSTMEPNVHEQHVISRVLLGNWTEPASTQPGAERKLVRHNLATGRAKHRTTGQVGYQRDFVKIDSQAVEKVWQRVEGRLRAAISTAEAGTLFSHDELVSIIRQAIALHFARSPQTLAIHLTTFNEVHARQIDALTETDLAVEAFRRQYGGLLPAGREGRRLGAQIVLARLAETVDSGAVFRLTVEDRFDTVTDLFHEAGLEILAPEDPNDEFLIGDTPALTVDSRTGRAGVLSGVGLVPADTVILPLAPRLLVALGPRSQFASVPSTMVDRMNQLQVRAAQAYVCYRPGARVAAQIIGWRAPNLSPTAEAY